MSLLVRLVSELEAITGQTRSGSLYKQTAELLEVVAGVSSNASLTQRVKEASIIIVENGGNTPDRIGAALSVAASNLSIWTDETSSGSALGQMITVLQESFSGFIPIVDDDGNTLAYSGNILVI